jgi:hypothetical protein
MSVNIVFAPINVEEQKSKVQFESEIKCNDNGKEVPPEAETGWIKQDYSGFAPKKFIEDPSKRDWVKISLDPKQEACIELASQLTNNDNTFESTRNIVLGKYNKLYKFLPSIKQPKGKDEEVLSDDEDDTGEKTTSETTDSKPKYDSVKMKLKMDWFYYYNNVRLDRANTSAIKKAVFELLKNTKTANLDKEKKKAAISALLIKLTFKDDDGKKETVDVLMKDIEQRKEIDTKIFYRKPEKLEQNVKLPSECSEEELVQLYGDPMDPKDVKTPDDLDKYYTHGCYVRFLYKPMLLWASKDKMPGADKRTCGIKYIINQIDIIKIPYETNYSSSQKTIYSKYAFGKKNMLINQSVDSVFTSTEKSSIGTLKNEELNKNVNVEKSKLSPTKKEIKVESDNEEEDDDNDEDDDEEEEEESSESESEEEVQVKPTRRGGGKNVKNRN